MTPTLKIKQRELFKRKMISWVPFEELIEVWAQLHGSAKFKEDGMGLSHGMGSSEE